LITSRRRTVDIYFPKARVAVDVRGCFWHGCPEHGTIPRSNRDWWQAKLAATQARDAETEELLSAEGYAVVIVWEHEDSDKAADRVAELVKIRLGQQLE
jgi:DNA mismatch endonuclease (patch repair protein)